MTRIRQLRLEYNLSQRALAQKIGASQKAVDLWEKGMNEPKASTLIALANLFECSIDYLLGRSDDIGNVNVMRDLSDTEKRMLTVFSRLNDNRRNEVIDYAEFLTRKN